MYIVRVTPLLDKLQSSPTLFVALPIPTHTSALISSIPILAVVAGVAVLQQVFLGVLL
jgi:hypothetical protein